MAAMSDQQPLAFIVCQRSDGSEYEHPLLPADIGPQGEWQITVPDGTRVVAGRRVMPGDTVSGRLTIE